MKGLLFAFTITVLGLSVLHYQFDLFNESKQYLLELKKSPMAKGVFGVILVMFLILFGYQLLNNQNTEEKNKKYCQQVSVDQYQSYCNDATQKALKELESNPQYQQMLKAKGQDMSQWNWQERENRQKQEQGNVPSIDKK